MPYLQKTYMPTGTLSADLTTLAEVVDNNNKPIMIMSYKDIYQQQLYHKAVWILLFDCKKRLIIQKRQANKKFYPSLWDISSSAIVPALESYFEAGYNKLKQKLGIKATKLIQIGSITPNSTNNSFISIFQALAPRCEVNINFEEIETIMAVNHNELQSLLKNYKEILTPALIWIAENNHIFLINKMKTTNQL